MVHYVRDQTGRFPHRPHYAPEELDNQCEAIITAFMADLHDEWQYPIETEDLKTLIERDTEDLDVYADLSAYGTDVEGVTEFHAGHRPSVKLASHLTEDTRRENRLRTTLTHEYGHVTFHSSLFETQSAQADVVWQDPNRNKIICKRDSMLDSSQSDWMEWQAGYACGALLMPKSAVIASCRRYADQHRILGEISLQSDRGAALIASIASSFKVSSDAARVRLLKLNLMVNGPVSRTLFD